MPPLSLFVPMGELQLHCLLELVAAMVHAALVKSVAFRRCKFAAMRFIARHLGVKIKTQLHASSCSILCKTGHDGSTYEHEDRKSVV